MAYYDALIAKWATLTGTTAQKLATINALTVASPIRIDVAPSQVVRYLAINGKLAGLLKYAQTPPLTSAGVAAAELVAVLNMGQNAPPFYTSAPTDYAALQNMLNAMVSDTATGITTADATNLLALAAPQIAWWQANGYTSPFTQPDLDAAGGLT